ncbi:Protein of unknown function DUF2294 [Stanieria cyanosphaera PCC 7437]|uniref:Na+-translocating membrane potential-generating system MpsC domain-containing protein n=1 Tax=Stanieria cyanosphaera (strain ATCC 29371 / PCC 7437) TaxID=111780 RepID=K9XXT7_STAC7|nr:DUF2294 domain-containing protein [Stanieria cyanosphaera]AFZ36472.1 Protein of unknown function DUF2294 [Stanieria cyanosphaera PCC 7437]
MTETLPTRGQLERQISQKLQAFYRNRLGHQPSKITCQLFDQKLAIIIEESITQAEQILVKEGKKELAEQVHSQLDDAIQPELKQVVEEIIKVKIIDLLSDATLQTGRTGMIAVLDQTPQVRNPDTIPKVKS